MSKIKEQLPSSEEVHSWPAEKRKSWFEQLLAQVMKGHTQRETLLAEITADLKKAGRL